MEKKMLAKTGRAIRLVAVLSLLGLLALGGRLFRVIPGGDGKRQSRPSATMRGGAEAAASAHSNRLANETSPYLLMHSHNPVDWYPWGEEAFEKARKEDKPIFLSVGYSTCYWCQVMERESFTDLEVAKVMNRLFVSIKVDREQRPDIDEQFMMATQLVTGRGGWPNSVWLTPDGKPWMAGTYWPKAQFIAVLEGTAKLWRERKSDVLEQAGRLTEAIRKIGAGGFRAGDPGGDILGPALVEQAVTQFRNSYDTRNGGFGGAPKFPPHGALALLSAEYQRTRDQTLVPLITGTMDAIWLGGIHDHLGGGFHRYATDAHWGVPHFEKMLYDNAQLLGRFADAYVISRTQRYRDAIEGIVTWMSTKMSHPGGGLYSAINAEIDGEEGRGYLWHRQEVLDVLGKEDGKFFCEIYNVLSEGNHENERTRQKTGENILFLTEPIEKLAEKRGVAPEVFRSKLAVMRGKLLERRATWTQPAIDDKILTAWNGLAIEGLARAGRLLEEPRYTKIAEDTAKFILKTLYRDGRLFRSYRGGKIDQPGYLDDHVYLAAGLLELYRATGNPRWLSETQRLAETISTEFHDGVAGGFFFTTAAHEELLSRSKHLAGGGNVPNANGLAAQVLLELGRITGREDFLAAARETLRPLAGFMRQSPGAMESALVAISQLSRPVGSPPASATVAVAGGRENATETSEVRAEAGPVVVEAFVSRSRAAPGQTFKVAIALDIMEGWHLYGENPGIDFLVPAAVEMVPAAGLETGSPQRPKPVQKTDPVLNQKVSTLSGKVWFLIPVVISRDALPGKRTLTFKVVTQACDKSRCLPEKTTEIVLGVLVDPEISSGNGHLHSGVFEKFAGENSQEE